MPVLSEISLKNRFALPFRLSARSFAKRYFLLASKKRIVSAGYLSGPAGRVLRQESSVRRPMRTDAVPVPLSQGKTIRNASRQGTTEHLYHSSTCV